MFRHQVFVKGEKPMKLYWAKNTKTAAIWPWKKKIDILDAPGMKLVQKAYNDSVLPYLKNTGDNVRRVSEHIKEMFELLFNIFVEEYKKKGINIDKEFEYKLQETVGSLLAYYIRKNEIYRSGNVEQIVADSEITRDQDIRDRIRDIMNEYISKNTLPETASPASPAQPTVQTDKENKEVLDFETFKKEIQNSLQSNSPPTEEVLGEIERQKRDDSAALAEKAPQMTVNQVKDAALKILREAGQIIVNLNSLYMRAGSSGDWSAFISYVQQYFYVEIVDEIQDATAQAAATASSKPTWTLKMSQDGTVTPLEANLVMRKIPVPGLLKQPETPVQAALFPIFKK